MIKYLEYLCVPTKDSIYHIIKVKKKIFENFVPLKITHTAITSLTQIHNLGEKFTNLLVDTVTF